MDLLGVTAYWQMFVRGGVIVLAVVLDAMKYKKRK
jgi:ABC-type glucose/galactose transport system permease subunit